MLRANRALGIDGKQVGLFVARMRLWRRQNSQASLEDYLLYLEQRGFNRWSKTKIHELVDWFWDEETKKPLTQDPFRQPGPGCVQSTPRKTAGRPKATALPAPGPLVMLAVAVLVDTGLITSRKGPLKVHVKKIRAVANQL